MRVFGEKYLRSHSVGSTTTTTLDLQMITNTLDQSKVSQLDNTFLRYEDVLELQVSVDKVLLLKNVDSLDDLFEVVEDKRQLVVAVVELLREIPLAELKDDEEGAVVADYQVNLDDVGRV